jgi:hypothetical protein
LGIRCRQRSHPKREISHYKLLEVEVSRRKFRLITLNEYVPTHKAFMQISWPATGFPEVPDHDFDGVNRRSPFLCILPQSRELQILLQFSGAVLFLAHPYLRSWYTRILSHRSKVSHPQRLLEPLIRSLKTGFAPKPWLCITK